MLHACPERQGPLQNDALQSGMPRVVVVGQAVVVVVLAGWHVQSQPHAPFGTPPHVIPGGQVPHLQKLHNPPLSLGSPQGIAGPVQPHVVPLQVMPCGHNPIEPQPTPPPSKHSAPPQ